MTDDEKQQLRQIRATALVLARQLEELIGDQGTVRALPPPRDKVEVMRMKYLRGDALVEAVARQPDTFDTFHIAEDPLFRSVHANWVDNVNYNRLIGKALWAYSEDCGIEDCAINTGRHRSCVFYKRKRPALSA